MLPLFLSVLLLILTLATPGDKAPKPVAALLPLARMLGLIFSIGLIATAGFQFLNGGIGKPGSLSFRTGALEPHHGGDDSAIVRVRYSQRAWFGMKQDGQWHARPTRDGCWQYFVPGTGWRDVPESVYQPASDDDREFSQDNRGYYEN